MTLVVRKRFGGVATDADSLTRSGELILCRRDRYELAMRGFVRATLPSCLDCRQKGLHPDDVHDAREIVGEHVQGHLGRNLGQALHQKVGSSHPHLERAEGMLGRLAAHAHRLRVRIEPLLHRFEQMFVRLANEDSKNEPFYRDCFMQISSAAPKFDAAEAERKWDSLRSSAGQDRGGRDRGDLSYILRGNMGTSMRS